MGAQGCDTISICSNWNYTRYLSCPLLLLLTSNCIGIGALSETSSSEAGYTEVRIRGRHFWTGDLSSFSTRPVSLRRFILNALPSCLPISNNHSICASLRNCLMWILRRPILGLDYYSPFSPWSFPIQFITKILQVWLCRTQFHLHSLWQWFLTLALSDRLHCFFF